MKPCSIPIDSLLGFPPGLRLTARRSIDSMQYKSSKSTDCSRGISCNGLNILFGIDVEFGQVLFAGSEDFTGADEFVLLP